MFIFTKIRKLNCYIFSSAMSIETQFWFSVTKKRFSILDLKFYLKKYFGFWILNPFVTHQWPYKFSKPQWPYHGLSDQSFFSKTFYTWTLMTIPRSHRPGFFKPSLWEHGMITGGLGQKPDWKKWFSLSDSDMVTGGVKKILDFGFEINFSRGFWILTWNPFDVEFCPTVGLMQRFLLTIILDDVLSFVHGLQTWQGWKKSIIIDKQHSYQLLITTHPY